MSTITVSDIPLETTNPARRLRSIAADGVEPPARNHHHQRMTTPTSTPSMNGHDHPTPMTGRRITPDTPEKSRVGLPALIAEAQAVREAARDTFTRAGRLLMGVKRHRQQSRLVAATLASLKQLQTIND